MDEKLKSLIAQYCQYPTGGIFDRIYQYVDDFPCPVADMAGYVSVYHEVFDFIKRFDREFLTCGWEGEKADYLLDSLEESYFAYWEGLRY